MKPVSDPPQNVASPPIVGLTGLVAALPVRAMPPVELWNPAYCGDIGIEILRDGSWHYQGSVIARPAMVALFASVLRKDEDGQTYLVTPAEKILVRVADAPFVGVELSVTGHGDQQLIGVRTNLDDWVQVGLDHPLRFELQAVTGGLKPYVRVRGRLEALLSRGVYFDLVALAERNSVGRLGQQIGVWSDGVWWPLQAL
jgi:uncharacterized protein